MAAGRECFFQTQENSHKNSQEEGDQEDQEEEDQEEEEEERGEGEGEGARGREGEGGGRGGRTHRWQRTNLPRQRLVFGPSKPGFGTWEEEEGEVKNVGWWSTGCSQRSRGA